MTRDGLLGWRDVPFPGGLVGGAADFERRLVFLLQLLANLVERRELSPTRSDSTGSRYSVALAGSLHPSFDDLATKDTTKKKVSSERRNLTKEPIQTL